MASYDAVDLPNQTAGTLAAVYPQQELGATVDLGDSFDDVDASDDDEDTERISLRRSNICQPKLLSCDQSHVFCALASSCRNPHTFASVTEATKGT